MDNGLGRLCTRTEADPSRLGQDKGMEQEHRTVWEDIREVLELAQKEEGRIALASQKSQVSKIDSFTKKTESAVRTSVDKLKDLT